MSFILGDDEQKELQERLRRKRKQSRRKRRLGDDEAGLTLNSMMDIMLIILIFLLKSYGEEPIKILPDTDLPFSTSEIVPTDTTVVTITDNAIVAADKEVVRLTDRKVDKTQKKGGATGLIIQPLETALRDEVEKQKNFARQTNSEFQGEMTIVADVETPYRLVAEVMQTAIASEYKKFRFAVIKGKLGISGTASAN